MKQLEREVIRWGKALFDRRLISGWGGNLSCRREAEEFLITGQHAPLGFLEPKDLVRIDGAGRPIDKHRHASSETPMHLAVYRGTDARAIVHVHPPMAVAFSVAHDRFVPLSFEEKYTLGEVPVIAQDTPTVTRPELLVEELHYHPIVIIKGHGTVAIGKDFQEAFLFTDLLEQAVQCHFFQDRRDKGGEPKDAAGATEKAEHSGASAHHFAFFSPEHLEALVREANADREFRGFGRETQLSTTLTFRLDETGACWTVRFVDGEITAMNDQTDGDFLISGEEQWWRAVFTGRIDPFLATQQGKLRLQRGDLAELSRWYKPFHRAFSIWQTIPIH